MEEYIVESLNNFPEDCTHGAQTIATINLFTVNDDCKKLNEERRKLLHSIIEKIAFCCELCSSRHPSPHKVFIIKSDKSR